jgi:hypothetical protein
MVTNRLENNTENEKELLTIPIILVDIIYTAGFIRK